MSRSFVVGATLTLLALLVPLPTSIADAAFAEDWETGTDGWTFNGLGGSLACGDATHGCSYRLEPPCCSTWTTATHGVSIPLAGRLALDFQFRADDLTGSTDSDVLVGFNDGSMLYETTNWYNNGLGLVTSEESEQGFAFNGEAGAWLHLRLLMDGDAHLAQAQVIAENGTVAGASRVLSFSPAATTITTIGLRAISWGWGTGFQYDDLILAPTDACFAPVARIGANSYGTVGEPVDFQIQAASYSCDAFVGWSVDFGDGAAVVGEGAPPANVTHVYETGAYLDVTLATSLASGSTLTHVLWFYVHDPCLSPEASIEGPLESRVNTTTRFDLSLDIADGCPPPLSWRVDFGDHSYVEGEGALPSNVTHVYTTKARFFPLLEVVFPENVVAWATTSHVSYDIGIQYANRSALAETWPVQLTDGGFVVLEKTGAHGSRLRLTFTSVASAGDLDAIFYDAKGVRMASQPCRAFLAPEDCAIPIGAAYVRVQGDAVGARWALEHEYRI